MVELDWDFESLEESILFISGGCISGGKACTHDRQVNYDSHTHTHTHTYTHTSGGSRIFHGTDIFHYEGNTSGNFSCRGGNPRPTTYYEINYNAFSFDGNTFD